MSSKPGQTFDLTYPLAFGAGLAAALLCLVARQGTLAATSIASFSPLPILIATIGFGSMPGLVAAAVGTAAILFYAAMLPVDSTTAKLIYMAFLGGSFVVMLALPAWWIGRLARLGRSDKNGWRDAGRNPTTQAVMSYPLSRILAHAALLATAVVILFLTALVLDTGGFEAFVEHLAARVAPYILEVAGTRELPAGMDLRDLSRFYVRLFPPVLTSVYFVLALANLWLAGKVVHVSGLLVRPWPDIVQNLRLPRVLALVFFACAGPCLLDGFAGTAAACATAALGMGFVLQGLAVIHFLTRGIRFRSALLAALYVIAGLMPLMFVPFAVIGLLDAGFSFRERRLVTAPQKS